MNTYCDSLLYCFSSTAITGVRAGGGIGEWIKQAVREDSPYYWYRMAFDLLYFVLVVVVLLNIVFGIIIDTFAELRD